MRVIVKLTVYDGKIFFGLPTKNNTTATLTTIDSNSYLRRSYLSQNLHDDPIENDASFNNTTCTKVAFNMLGYIDVCHILMGLALLAHAFVWYPLDAFSSSLSFPFCPIRAPPPPLSLSIRATPAIRSDEVGRYGAARLCSDRVHAYIYIIARISCIYIYIYIGIGRNRIGSEEERDRAPLLRYDRFFTTKRLHRKSDFRGEYTVISEASCSRNRKKLPLAPRAPPYKSRESRGEASRDSQSALEQPALASSAASSIAPESLSSASSLQSLASTHSSGICLDSAPGSPEKSGFERSFRSAEEERSLAGDELSPDDQTFALAVDETIAILDGPPIGEEAAGRADATPSPTIFQTCRALEALQLTSPARDDHFKVPYPVKQTGLSVIPYVPFEDSVLRAQRTELEEFKSALTSLPPTGESSSPATSLCCSPTPCVEIDVTCNQSNVTSNFNLTFASALSRPDSPLEANSDEIDRKSSTDVDTIVNSVEERHASNSFVLSSESKVQNTPENSNLPSTNLLEGLGSSLHLESLTEKDSNQTDVKTPTNLDVIPNEVGTETVRLDSTVLIQETDWLDENQLNNEQEKTTEQQIKKPELLVEQEIIPHKNSSLPSALIASTPLPVSSTPKRKASSTPKRKSGRFIAEPESSVSQSFELLNNKPKGLQEPEYELFKPQQQSTTLPYPEHCDLEIFQEAALEVAKKIDASLENIEENERFVSATAELFEDPAAFDFFNQVGSQNCKRSERYDSLYMTFDPLAQRLSMLPQKNAPSPLPNEQSIKDSKEETSIGDTGTPKKNPAIAAIDRLLFFSPSAPTSTENEVAEIKEKNDKEEEKQEPQQEVTPVVDEKMVKELELVRSTVLQLEAELANQKVTYEDKINNLQTKLTQEVNCKEQMTVVVEEYEKSISRLIAEREKDRTTSEAEKAKLQEDLQVATQHLSNTEAAFNDVHSKYERLKNVISVYKSNETVLKESISENQETIRTLENRYEQLKSHAMAQLEKANLELSGIKKHNEAEIVKLKALVRRAELKSKSLEETVEQKLKEIKELTQIIDEMIARVD